MFSWKKAQARDVFLAVLPISDDRAPELPVALPESPATFVLTLADRVVVLSKTGKLIEEPISVNVPAGRECPLLLTGLAAGQWSIRGQDANVRYDARVEPGKNTALVVAPGGRYSVEWDAPLPAREGT